MDEASFPSKDPSRGSLSDPGKTLAGAARPHQQSEPPLSPRVPTQPTTLGLGLGRHLRGSMQIFVKTRNIQSQMRIKRQRSSARSLPRRATRPPARSLPGTTARHGKTLARPAGKALAKDASRATARPAPTKSPPPFTWSCQPDQLGRHLRGNMQLPGQLIKRPRGGMQIFVKTLPPRHLSCLPAYMAPHALLAWARVEARRGGNGRDGPRPRPR